MLRSETVAPSGAPTDRYQMPKFTPRRAGMREELSRNLTSDCSLTSPVGLPGAAVAPVSLAT
jgi:hypothetical protein